MWTGPIAKRLLENFLHIIEGDDHENLEDPRVREIAVGMEINCYACAKL